MPQSTLDPVAISGGADRFAHDETDPGRPSTRPEDDVGDQGRSSGTSTGTHGGTELVTVGHPLLTRKHRGLRPRASRGPCGDGRPGWRGRRGCACGGGSRASWHDGGCSAGTYACSRSDSFEDRAGSTATGNPRCGSADRCDPAGSWARGRCRPQDGHSTVRAPGDRVKPTHPPRRRFPRPDDAPFYTGPNVETACDTPRDAASVTPVREISTATRVD